MEKYLVVGREKNGDIQKVYRFENNYGASVIKFPGSYGYEQGEWELAVIRFPSDGGNFRIDFETPITDNVLGYLSWREVEEHLKEIKSLG